MSSHNIALADPTAFAPSLAEPRRQASPDNASDLRRGARLHLVTGAAIIASGMLTMLVLPIAGNVLEVFGVPGLALTSVVGAAFVLWGCSHIAESHVLRQVERARHRTLTRDDRAPSPAELYAHLAGAPDWASPNEAAWFAAGDALEG